MDPFTGGIIALSTIAGLGSKGSKSSGSQTDTKTPYPRDFSTQQIWDQYMSRVLGSSAYPMMNFNFPAAGGTNSYSVPVSLGSILDQLAMGKKQGGTIGNLAVKNPDIIQQLGLGGPTTTYREPSPTRFNEDRH